MSCNRKYVPGNKLMAQTRLMGNCYRLPYCQHTLYAVLFIALKEILLANADFTVLIKKRIPKHPDNTSPARTDVLSTLKNTLTHNSPSHTPHKTKLKFS